MKRHLFVISGPSGVGKSTLIHRALAADPRLKFLVSYTTRPRRPGERDGVHYHFVDEARFQQLVRAGELIEHAEYNGYWYGNSLREIEQGFSRGFDLIKDIETQGAAQLRARREALGFPLRFVFVLPPSLEELERRIRGRGTEDPARVAERLRIARRELAEAPRFDVQIVNDDLARATAELLEVIARARAGRR